MGNDRPPKPPKEKQNMLDWLIVGDIYDLKNEAYDPEYLNRLEIGEQHKNNDGTLLKKPIEDSK